jgi:glycosyltransferase involved in cell wall biosynthesis
MRVHVVDPSAYTPPYDHALCSALAHAGAEVSLYTSRFAYGPVAPADSYARRELFYRGARFAAGSTLRRASKLVEHVPDMLLYRRAARDADVVHFQWLAVQHLDGRLLPSRLARGGRRRPLVLTAHDVLPREPRPGQRAAQRRLYEHFDAVVVHTEHGRRRLTGELGVDGERVHVIPHGALTHLGDAPLASPPFAPAAPVVLFFGLLRPYKGLDVLLEAWRGIADAELWVVGMPRMDLAPLRALAPAGVRFVTRFVSDAELRACIQAATLVVLPYREIDQSGAMFTALACAKPLLLSDAGGFEEIARAGAARAVPAGDAQALHAALEELLGDRAALESMSSRALALARGEYAWSTIARRTIELYRALLKQDVPS